MKLRSGTAKRKKTSILDIEENVEIEKAIRLSRRSAPRGANIENLEKKLFLQCLGLCSTSKRDSHFVFLVLTSSYILFEISGL